MIFLPLLDKFYTHSTRKSVDETYLSKALLQLIREKTKDYEVEFEYGGLHQPGSRPILAIAGNDEMTTDQISANVDTIIKRFSGVTTGHFPLESNKRSSCLGSNG